MSFLLCSVVIIHQHLRRLGAGSSAGGVYITIAVTLEQACSTGPLQRRYGPFADLARIRLGKDIGILAAADVNALILCVIIEDDG